MPGDHEAYEGVFILCGKGEPYRIGLDHNGCFVRRPSGEELFRSMKFEQIYFGGDNFEFRDHSTLKQSRHQRHDRPREHQ